MKELKTYLCFYRPISTLRSNGNSMFFSLRNISRTRYFHLNFLIRIFKILSLLIINLFMEITQPDQTGKLLTSRNSETNVILILISLLKLQTGVYWIEVYFIIYHSLVGPLCVRLRNLL